MEGKNNDQRKPPAALSGCSTDREPRLLSAFTGLARQLPVRYPLTYSLTLPAAAGILVGVFVGCHVVPPTVVNLSRSLSSQLTS